MLAFISDLHLTDGTSGETIREGAFRIYSERLRDMAYDASWRKDKKYKPIESIDLVLLGDILDVIRSTSWVTANVRPWDQPRTKDFAPMVGKITDGILKTNANSLQILNDLAAGKTITLPPATADGCPELKSTKRVPVKVSIHYLVGNHDWFFHLKGKEYDDIRASIVKAIGLKNDPKVPFPHDPAESAAVAKVYDEHHVFARHGDIYDAFNYEGDRDKSSLGDAIVIELLNRFPEAVNAQMKGTIPKEFYRLLREIDNVRPVTIVPVWINGLARKMLAHSEQEKVKRIWNQLVDEFFKIPFVKQHDSWFNPADEVDKLQFVLKITQTASFESLSRLSNWIREKIAARDQFSKNAFSEREFKSREASYIVYGHTHQPEIVALDSACLGNTLCNQLYFNSGTWRQVHELAQFDPAEQEFMGYHVMTYLAFYKDDERLGRPFEYWSGALASE